MCVNHETETLKHNGSGGHKTTIIGTHFISNFYYWAVIQVLLNFLATFHVTHSGL